MKRNIALLLALAGAVAVAWTAEAKMPLTLKSVAVTLPKDASTLPDGPEVATVHNNCLGCHSAGMILNQPAMPKAAWAAEVAKMRNVYKAPVEEKDVPAIVEYLAAVKGPK